MLHSRQRRDRWADAGLIVWVIATWASVTLAQSPANPSLCRAAQLEPFTENQECGSGRCYQALELRNVGMATCTLPANAHVTAFDKQLNAMPPTGRIFSFSADKPLILAPGEFGVYTSESYSSAMFPHAPRTANRFVFRFSPQDPGLISFLGNQAVQSSPQNVFNQEVPAPDLSTVPHQGLDGFVFSAYPWPPLVSDNGTTKRSFLEEDSSLGSVHVSVKNQGEVASREWNKCRIVVDSSEIGAQSAHQRSTYPCTWNGDIVDGVVAAGATVAREVDAKLPKVCHRASYTVLVSIENAPVRFEPITLNTPEMQPLCSDSRPSVVTSSAVPPPAVPDDMKSLRINWGLPVDGVRLGLEIPVRRYLYDVIAIDDPGDPVVAAVWVDNGRDTPLPLSGPHGFHLRILNGTPPPGITKFNSPLELTPHSGSDETGAIDITVPPHTLMRVADLDLSTEYDFTMGLVPRQEFLVSVYTDALSGEDVKRNWENDKKNIWALKALTSFRVEPPGVSK